MSHRQRPVQTAAAQLFWISGGSRHTSATQFFPKRPLELQTRFPQTGRELCFAARLNEIANFLILNFLVNFLVLDGGGGGPPRFQMVSSAHRSACGDADSGGRTPAGRHLGGGGRRWREPGGRYGRRRADADGSVGRSEPLHVPHWSGGRYLPGTNYRDTVNSVNVPGVIRGLTPALLGASTSAATV